MIDRLGEEWYNLLKDEFPKDYMIKLQEFLAIRRKQITVYPSKEDLFNAYKLTPYSSVKVVIIGQDPYINPNEAMGLAFSTRGKWTPSLRKIAGAVNSEVWDNDLTRWADQGVFLLNTLLTVDSGKSLSHQGKGWEQFTLRTIEELDKKGNVIFLLWGRNAQEYDKYITKGINNVLMCEHPVAASYQNRDWLFNNCFQECNKILRELGEEEIKW